MKIKGISALVVLAFAAFAFTVSIAHAVESEVVLQAETTLALCSDGIDNDDNGSSDAADENCADVSAEVEAPALVLENTAELCSDGIDNDDNGSSDSADENCMSDSEVTEPALVLENTYALCHDGIDNDDNGSSDSADENCIGHDTEQPVLVLENTAELCSDGIDNDDNGSSDAADENCLAFSNPDNNGGNNGGSDNDDDDDNRSSRSSSGQKKSSKRPSSQGEVLGAFSGSCPFITGYMRLGWANDVEQVKKLQEFLNSELNLSLPVTGFFGQLTYDAVNAFQLKYKDDVLQPWVEAGLHASEEIPTGFVYITTAHKINEIVCPDFDEKLPALVPASN